MDSFHGFLPGCLEPVACLQPVYLQFFNTNKTSQTFSLLIFFLGVYFASISFKKMFYDFSLLNNKLKQIFTKT